jgi:hypothetical protein
LPKTTVPGALLTLAACVSPAMPDAGVPDSGVTAGKELWLMTFPRWVSAAQPDAGEPGTCSYLWGMEDFYALPSRASEWAESRKAVGALIVPPGVLIAEGHTDDVPGLVDGWRALHDTEGMRVGFEASLYSNQPRWQFDPTVQFSAGVPWYAPIEVLQDAGIGDDLIYFIDVFDSAAGLNVKLLDLTPDAFAGPLADEVKAVRDHAPNAFAAVHMLLPYMEDGTSGIVDREVDWMRALRDAAAARGTRIDAILFDTLRSKPPDVSGGALTLDTDGFGKLIDAARGDGFKVGAFIMSYQDSSAVPPSCGFPQSGTDFESSAVAGVSALKQAGLDAKIDFYDLSSWTRWPRQALPQNQPGTLTHALCAVENALSLGCAVP